MNWKSEWKKTGLFVAVFLALYLLPVGTERFDNAILEALYLTQWYAREHVLLCLIPAFFLAGGVAVFVSQASIMKYLGSQANKVVAYGVASVSGSLLAVCSCTVLPLFAGIYRMGAGIGPATAFLYSGPAVNVLAVILTARVLGPELGIARAVGAIVFSVVIGGIMHFVFRKEEEQKSKIQMVLPEDDGRPLWQNTLFFMALFAILVFANWGKPEASVGFWAAVYDYKWVVTGGSAVFLGFVLVRWFGFSWLKAVITGLPVCLLAVFVPRQPQLAFSAGVVVFSVFASLDKGESGQWFVSSWEFAKQILPLLFLGVLVAGALLGRAGHEGLLPAEWIIKAVGGNSLFANFFASVAGAFMYFATLTEIPILQGLIGNGMGKGPALALLLAGPALSLPNMLVIQTVLGTQKTIVFVALVILMATFSGVVFGNF